MYIMLCNTKCRLTEEVIPIQCTHVMAVHVGMPVDVNLRLNKLLLPDNSEKLWHAHVQAFSHKQGYSDRYS